MLDELMTNSLQHVVKGKRSALLARKKKAPYPFRIEKICLIIKESTQSLRLSIVNNAKPNM